MLRERLSEEALQVSHLNLTIFHLSLRDSFLRMYSLNRRIYLPNYRMYSPIHRMLICAHVTVLVKRLQEAGLIKSAQEARGKLQRVRTGKV
jgi:hypothetical protein